MDARTNELNVITFEQTELWTFSKQFNVASIRGTRGC